MILRTGLRWFMAIAMVFAGLNHFRSPTTFIGMMPTWLPAHALLVQISGVAEIAGGLGLLIPQTRKLAGYGLILLFIAIFPANLNMALHHLPLGDTPVPTWALWARLPLQVVLIGLAWWVAIAPKSAIAPTNSAAT